MVFEAKHWAQYEHVSDYCIELPMMKLSFDAWNTMKSVLEAMHGVQKEHITCHSINGIELPMMKIILKATKKLSHVIKVTKPS